MNHYQNLTAGLRYRGTPRSDIANIVAEVRAHTPAGDPAGRFGKPLECAEQFAAAFPAREPRADPVLIILTILAIGYTVFALLAEPILGIEVRDYVGPVLLRVSHRTVGSRDVAKPTRSPLR